MSVRATNLGRRRRGNLEEKSFLYHKQNSSRRVSEGSNNERLEYGRRRCQPPKRPGLLSRPIRFLKHFAGEIARALCMVTGKRRSSSSSSSSSTPGKNSLSARSKPFVTPLDSQRVEAIEDCIQFINSSCTFSRSNSTTNS